MKEALKLYGVLCTVLYFLFSFGNATMLIEDWSYVSRWLCVGASLFILMVITIAKDMKKGDERP